MATWTDFRRDVCWLVKITLDQCANTFSDSPCTATGTPCYYSYPTCKDPSNYSKSSYTWYFNKNEGPLKDGVLPLVKDIQAYETRIDPKEILTVVGKLQIKMTDTEPLEWSCPGKTLNTAKHNRETAGTFWTNLKARNENYTRRDVELLVGLSSWSLSAYRTFFKGVLTNIQIGDDGDVTIEVKDQLKKIDRKLPKKQASTNVLTATYNGGATMSVTDASAFMDPAEHGGECVVKVEDEYVSYTALDTALDQLTGCTPGAYGTTAASHAASTQVKNVVVIADNTGSPASWADVPRMPADWCLLRVLCDLAGIAVTDTATKDYGVTLSGGIGAGDGSLTVSDGTDLSYRGILKIDSEWLYFGARSGASCTGLRRGLFGSSAAAHLDGADIYLSEFSDEAGRWLASNLYKFRTEKETALKDVLQDLRVALGTCHVWAGEDAKVHCKMAQGLTGLDSPLDLTDAEDLVDKVKPAHDDGEEDRRTAVLVAYSPNVADAAKGTESEWGGFLDHWNPDLEGVNYLNETFREVVWNPWIWTEADAMICAAYRLLRRQHGLKTLRFALDLSDAEQVEVGDFVKITTEKVVGITGAARQSVTYEVLKKKRLDDITYEYEAWDVTGGVDGARHGVIAPASVTCDYDDATADEKDRYAWVSDTDGKVGADKDDGYEII